MRKLFKYILGVGSTILLTAGLVGTIFGVASIRNNDTLVFGNFGEYESTELETSIASNIKKNYGINVEYTYYNLNNQLPAMYANNQISIGVPTDYEAAELISEGLIKPLNYSYFNNPRIMDFQNSNSSQHGLGYYLDGNFVKIENGILPIQVNLSQIDSKYNIPYTNTVNTSLPLDEQYATEYKYSICNLLSPGTIGDLTQIYLHCDFNGMKHIDILDYDLPYFFQNYTFAYTTYGCKDPSQFDSLSQEQPWSYILNTIKTSGWFKSENGRPKIGMVSSPQSVYSVAASIQNANGDETPITNPIESNSSISWMQETYSYFSKELSSQYLGVNSMYLSQSSAGIINELDNSQLNGGFCYNGDALYTAMGGNFANSLTSSQWAALTPSTFHVVHPKYTMIALDTVGINNSLPNNLIPAAYRFMYDLCLQGCDSAIQFSSYSNVNTNSYNWWESRYDSNLSLWNLITGNTNSKISCPYYSWLSKSNLINSPWDKNTENQNSFIGAINQNGVYTNNIMQNFSYNLYVSPWLNINSYVSLPISNTGANYINSQTGGSVQTGMNWFTTQDSYPFASNTSLSTYQSFNNWFENIYTINPDNYIYQIPSDLNYTITPNTCVELPLTQYQISNQQIAFNNSIRQNF